jgi:hypothetical protein
MVRISLKRLWKNALTGLLCVVFFSCLSCDNAGSQVVSFRLSDSRTGRALSNVKIALYDGHDRKLPPFGGPEGPVNNAPFHIENQETSADGTLTVDLAKFKDPHCAMLLESGAHYKYLRWKDGRIHFVRYQSKGVSLSVVAHHDCDLRTHLVTMTSFPDKKESKQEPFETIEVPMDAKEWFP